MGPVAAEVAVSQEERKQAERLREGYIRYGRLEGFQIILRWLSLQEPFGPMECTLFNLLNERILAEHKGFQAIWQD